MSDEFQVILSYLDTDDFSMKEFTKRIVALCVSPSGAQEAINELIKKADAYEADVRTCDNVPFCNLLLSFSYWHWGDRPQAARYADEAANHFNRCGDRWNHTLSIWGKAVIYQENNMDQSIAEYKSVYKSFSAIARDADRRNLRNKYEFSNKIVEQIRVKIKKLEERSAKSPAATAGPSHKNKRSQPNPWPTARIISGVNDFSHASRVGVYVQDDESISEMAISEIAFDDIKHNVYNLREGTQISLKSPGNYRWLRIAGNSMNRASPVPIDPGDYILADLDISPHIGNIVIANMNHPPTPAERAGVVKRYTANGLKSESSEVIEPIPLTEVDIRGVVIALAKPAPKIDESNG